MKDVLCLILAFMAGGCAGVWITGKAIRDKIQRADICTDDKRFINDQLGIPNQ